MYLILNDIHYARKVLAPQDTGYRENLGHVLERNAGYAFAHLGMQIVGMKDTTEVDQGIARRHNFGKIVALGIADFVLVKSHCATSRIRKFSY